MSDQQNDTKADDARDITKHMQDALQTNLNQQRQLWEEVSKFWKDESLRFTKQRLDRTNEAVEKLQGSNSPHDMISGQQEWFRELVKDYADQSVRYGEMFRTLTANAIGSAMSAEGTVANRAQEMGQEATDQARQADPIQ